LALFLLVFGALAVCLVLAGGGLILEGGSSSDDWSSDAGGASESESISFAGRHLFRGASSSDVGPAEGFSRRIAPCLAFK